jgi:hypothetical protein
MAPEQRKLDIFRILPDGSARWIEAVKSRVQAKERITQLMSVAPGLYRVHDPQTNTFIDVFARSA